MTLVKFASVHKKEIIFLLLLAAYIFLRFFDIEKRAVFGWDQVVNSWVVKDMILFGHRPLLGMIAKANTGFYIGPGFYYLLLPFYYVFRLDPIAGQVFAGVVSVISFIIFFLISDKIFRGKIALIASFIYTFSSHVLIFDRIPWPVIFIPVTSIVIFFSLWKVLNGEAKYLLLAAATVGFAFHTHFTAIYYVIIISILMPWILWKIPNAWIRLFQSIPLFLLFLIPNFIAEINAKFMYAHSMTGYLGSNYHGIHAQRIFQLSKDAFIEFLSILEKMSFMKYIPIYYFILPGLFIYLLFRKNEIRLVVLTILWFTVPWIVMSVYRGEITNYYFSITRPLVVIIIAYVSVETIKINKYIFSIVMLFLALYFTYININQYLKSSLSKLPGQKEYVKKIIREGKMIEFNPIEPEPYLYEIYNNVWGITGNE